MSTYNKYIIIIVLHLPLIKFSSTLYGPRCRTSFSTDNNSSTVFTPILSIFTSPQTQHFQYTDFVILASDSYYLSFPPYCITHVTNQEECRNQS